MAHILIIDDERDIREFLSSAFSFHGHNVALAEDGHLGLIAARTNLPDIIFLDLNMPVLDGVSVLEILKQDRALRTVPVIIISAQTEHQQIATCLQKGANDYVTKPFVLTELIARTNVQLRIQNLEQQIRKSETYHRALFERTSDPTLVIDQAGSIHQMNEVAARLLTDKSGPFLKGSIYDLIYHEDKKKFEVAFAGALDGSDIPIFEIHLFLPDNKQLPVDVDLCSIDIQEQQHILLRLRDIRRRKSAETQSSIILQYIGDAIFLTNQNGMIILASQSAGQLCGYSHESLIGLDITQFITDQTPLISLAPLESPNIHEGKLRRQTGETIPVEWTLASFTVAGEIFYIGVVRDLSDRHHAEMQRLETERLHALLEISGGAAHEINQPLTAILGYTGLSQSVLDPDHPIQAHQEQIIKAAERISGILKQMQNVHTYRTRPYAQGYRIVDFEQSSKKDTEQ